MEKYNHQKIEKKWQKYWEEKKIWETKEGKPNKFYILDMYPYPSAEGLHVGHPEGYTASDIVARYLRMNGYNVLHPMGWDAFGLPAENYAIKTGIHPKISTEKNIKNFRRQIKSLGFSYDWSREINTTDPDYYKWTQWVFLQMFKRGLAYESTVPINWCPSCKTGLANEEVVNGRCERCNTVVTKKNLRQWLLKITKYADRLLNGLDKLDWPEPIKLLQRNWIGRSEGAIVKFEVRNPKHETPNKSSLRSDFTGQANSHPTGDRPQGDKFQTNSNDQNSKQFIEVFTTRPDTLFGTTYMVLSPEHPLVAYCLSLIANRKEVEAYIKKARNKSDLERTELVKDKTGVELKGMKAINPVNNKKIPIWIADYVLASYGTGAIMAVPAHDERDYEFAKKYELPITQVIAPLFENKSDLILRKDKPMAERRVVNCIVRNSKNNTYLCQSWRKQSWNAFVSGSIENNEDIITAARREILEETGYKHLKYIRTLEWEIHVSFFAPHKDENRYARVNAVVFDLEKDTQDKVRNSELKQHQYVWLPKNKVREFLSYENLKYIWDLYEKSSPYTGEGTMINSEQFNGLSSEEGRKKIVEWLSSKTGQADNTCLVVHGVSGHKRENWFPWLKVELAKVGWETVVPTMPGAGHPTLDSWNDYLGQYDQKINENSIMVGHSIGCASILYHLQESGKKVDTVILVAPTNPLQKWPELKDEYPDIDWDAAENMNNPSNFDWKKICALAKHFIILHSDNDPYIPAESMVYYKKNLPEAEMHLIPGKSHFSESHGGIKSLPEILSFFPKRSSVSARAKAAVNYKLRDWVFSRQRYWGEPIPVVHCERCGVVPVPEKDLPVKLPEVKNYKPTGTGESPLANIKDWVNVKCPKCGSPAKRETNTMPQWAGSCWYYLRYLDPKNKKELVGKEKEKYWMSPKGVDLYVGGAEHAVLHLLYARFWHMFLYDIGVVSTAEPFYKLKNQGIILGEDNQKMSKSRGNVINPDDVIKEFGADSMRLYEMFMGPFEDAKPWSTKGLVGMYRFLDRIWKVLNKIIEDKDKLRIVNNSSKSIHKTIKKVTEDIENFKFNTAISELMIFFNGEDSRPDWRPKLNSYGQWQPINENFGKAIDFEAMKKFLILLSPFAPHLSEELWQGMGNKKSIAFEKWPNYNPKIIAKEEYELVVQVNGKLRDRINVKADISEEEAKKIALTSEKVKKYVKGEPRKIIFVKGRLVNLVI